MEDGGDWISRMKDLNRMNREWRNTFMQLCRGMLEEQRMGIKAHGTLIKKIASTQILSPCSLHLQCSLLKCALNPMVYLSNAHVSNHPSLPSPSLYSQPYRLILHHLHPPLLTPSSAFPFSTLYVQSPKLHPASHPTQHRTRSLQP